MLGIFGKFLVPFGFQFLALGASIPHVIDFLGDFKRQMVPADVGTGGGNLRIAQRRAVYFVGVGFIGRTQADYSFAANHRRLVAGPLGRFNRRLNGYRVVTVDIGHHMPAVSFKALGRVVGEPAFYMAVYGNTIVVVKTDQLA